MTDKKWKPDDEESLKDLIRATIKSAGAIDPAQLPSKIREQVKGRVSGGSVNSIVSPGRRCGGQVSWTSCMEDREHTQREEQRDGGPSSERWSSATGATEEEVAADAISNARRVWRSADACA